MSITITQPEAPARIGPGTDIFITLGESSVLLGDTITVFDNTSTLQAATRLAADQNTLAVRIGWDDTSGSFANSSAGLADDFSLTLQVVWRRADFVTVVESTTFYNYTWDATSNLVGLFQKLQQSITSPVGGIATDIASITDTLADPIVTTLTGVAEKLAGLVIPVRIDFFSQVNLTSGETCDPIDYDMSLAAYYGIILEITSYPSDWYFTTPDQAWSPADLAVIRFYVGSQLIERIGVHTITRTIAPLPGSYQPWFVNGLAEIQPLGFHVTVDWALGVCGQLIGLNWPI